MSSGDLKRKSAGEGEDTRDATKKTKMSFSLGLKKSSDGLKKASDQQEEEDGDSAQETTGKRVMKIAPVSMKLSTVKPKELEKKVAKPSRSVAKAFADESDEEEEDMPPEAKMRMKNIGRNTPTSAGPNSFNKGKMGFCSPSAKWKVQNLKSEAEKREEEKGKS
ncbi:PEST proteolytic signal-containing nuclear protein-like [Diadema antillarum]|uniref:PEST proteolytic signal-containing nuclear protein-like n=1 Tax=Diadema antillarum TaxID=105358 RepID=UPI003A873DCD